VPYGVRVDVEDESSGLRTEGLPVDNSVGRLLTLSDGVFAIAMTLLALDLKVPDVGNHPSDVALRHQLAANADSYLSYLLTFAIIAAYWVRHRRLLRSVVTIEPALIRDTLLLLLLVAAMPFPASLLGRYGSEPISLAIYAAMNVLANIVVIVTKWDVRRLGLVDHAADTAHDLATSAAAWATLGVFILCIPAGYVLGRQGPYALLLLALAGRADWLAARFHRSRKRPTQP
jgi:uncharacterized membrane protein